MAKKVIGIVGSYRKGRVIDTIVSMVLSGAKDGGAETEKLYLVDMHIEFCNNCRKCTQQVGDNPGHCLHRDDMDEILEKIEKADAIVIGSPINFFNITAVTRRFIERLLPFVYWPWGKSAPKFRRKISKKAILVTSSAAPSLIGRILMPSALKALKTAARCMGARPVKSIYTGPVAMQEKPVVSKRVMDCAYNTGRKLTQ